MPSISKILYQRDYLLNRSTWPEVDFGHSNRYLTPWKKTFKALSAFHSFTGNDYISVFHGIGKKIAFSLMVNNTEFANAFAKVGNHFVLDALFFKPIERFVYRLYGIKKTDNVDKARFLKFYRNNKKALESRQLPITQDFLLLHL